MSMADFRSDTMTAPCAEMRAAMADAEVGDDVWGEDPTITALEEEAAALLGKPAGLFLPSGTMANQVAIHVHCRPGDELICEERSHVFFYEGGAIARLSGTQARTLPSADGFLAPKQVEAVVRDVDDAHYPRSRLLVIENTHNMAGGRVASADRVDDLAQVARRHGIAVHVDGARLMNAAVALGVSARDLVAPADTSTLCLSKGLGAPVGSLLVGSVDFVREARRARKAFGGGMRQAGVLAAAGRIALQRGPGWLAEDHRRARELAEGLAQLPWAQVDVGATETNIVMAHVHSDVAMRTLEYLRSKGVMAAMAGPNRIRFVLHRDLDDEMVQRCLDVCRGAPNHVTESKK